MRRRVVWFADPFLCHGKLKFGHYIRERQLPVRESLARVAGDDILHVRVKATEKRSLWEL
jgi:hypothetical protein